MDLSGATAQFTILAFAGLLIAAAASDWRSLMIPNRYCLALVALFPSYVIAQGGDVAWMGHVLYGAGAFAAGFLLFSLRVCGGGDVKLFAAVALWAGPTLFLPMLIYTALCGGVMAVVLWIQHRIQRAGIAANLLFVKSDENFAKQPMPYAVAIAAGGLFVALQLLMGI
jgi:prepilin peptidase CpaA